MKQTKERMINVEVSVVCHNCDGHGARCVNGHSATDPNCKCRRKDWLAKDLFQYNIGPVFHMVGYCFQESIKNHMGT